MKHKKTISLLVSIMIVSIITCITAFAALDPVTTRLDVSHNGTSGTAYSASQNVNTSLHASTAFYYSSSVKNKPTSQTYSYAALKGKLYKGNSLYKTVVNSSNITVGNTSNSTIITNVDSGVKYYPQLNANFRAYIDVTCPPYYTNYSTFNFGGVFYGITY